MTMDDIPLLDAFFVYKPKVTHFWVFGCVAYEFLHIKKSSQFDEKGTKFIYVGYSFEKKGFWSWDSLACKSSISRDVAVIEFELLQNESMGLLHDDEMSLDVISFYSNDHQELVDIILNDITKGEGKIQ